MDLGCDFHNDRKASLHLMLIFAQEEINWIDCPAMRHRGIPRVVRKSFGGTPGQDI